MKSFDYIHLTVLVVYEWMLIYSKIDTFFNVDKQILFTGIENDTILKNPIHSFDAK